MSGGGLSSRQQDSQPMYAELPCEEFVSGAQAMGARRGPPQNDQDPFLVENVGQPTTTGDCFFPKIHLVQNPFGPDIFIL